MTFFQAIEKCFKKYADFNGRASRPEFWWWVLFAFLLSWGGQRINQSLGSILSLITLLPSLAVAARRLHDIGRSGWWQLVGLIPVLGWLVMIFWCVQPSEGPNQYDQ
ncbi:MAG: DUF805 domain-containing protein [Desulforhopalus sp.]|nr:DUF805 domain-containing protein [Desulforhopalus sp.]